jgi:hypothetical protein
MEPNYQFRNHRKVPQWFSLNVRIGLLSLFIIFSIISFSREESGTWLPLVGIIGGVGLLFLALLTKFFSESIIAKKSGIIYNAWLIIWVISLLLLAFFRYQEIIQEKIGVGQERITDETANWQTYKNEEYEFEIKYPGDWKVAENIFALKPSLVFCPANLATDPDPEVICKLKTGATKPQYEEGMIYLFNYDKSVSEPNNPAYHFLGLNSQGDHYYLYHIGNNELILSQMLSTFRFVETIDWQTYANVIFKYQIGYPSGFEVMPQTEKQKSQLGEGQNICIAKTGKDFCKLILNTFKLSQYKLVDQAGGFVFRYDKVKKQWVHDTTNETSQFAPQRTDASLEAYLYRTGDAKCSSEHVLIPNIPSDRLIAIINVTCRDDDGNMIEGYEDINSEQILSTFRFLE